LPAKIDTDALARLDAECPFCPGADAVPEAYAVKLIASGYPVVHADASGLDLTAYGLHTVFLYTSEHAGRLVRQSTRRVAELLEALGAETLRFLDDPRIEAVFGFEASGDHFGPTVDHPHGQLIGFTFTPRRQTLAEVPCRICEIATQEHNAPYVVDTSGAARIFVPPFARLPFEMWVVPERHAGRLADLDRSEIGELAHLLLVALSACVDAQGEMPPYLLTIMQAPKRNAIDHHLRIELMPLHRPNGGMKRPGGLEVGAGIYVNPLLPEDAAEMLRARLAEAVR
jgi:UDPglucose--hexose-1-phosphate uridylyltransferase